MIQFEVAMSVSNLFICPAQNP